MGRPRKHPTIPGDSASAVIVKGKGKSEVVEGAPAKGRKKRVATDKSLDEVPRKRVKIQETPNELPRTEQIVVKVPPKSTRIRLPITAPKWKVVDVVKSLKEAESMTGKATSSIKTLSPRIWTGSREELLALLPELAGAKCFNGVSWYKYPTPMVVLDDTDRCFEIEHLATQPLCLDIVTTRSFVCPIPPTPAQPTQHLAPSAQPSSAGATRQQVSSVKTPVIRKASRYRVPKSLGKSSITAKVEYVPSVALSPMEAAFTPDNTHIAISAPSTAGHGKIPQPMSLIAPDTMNATALPPTPPTSFPASSNEAPTRKRSSRLLPQTWNQVNRLDAMIDNAHRVFSQYGSARTPTVSRGEPPYPSHVFPYRISVQSSRSVPLASSSKMTLDDIEPSGGSSHSSGSLPPQSISVPAHGFPMADHIPATMSTHTNRTHLDSDPPASFDTLSPQDSEKPTTVHTSLVPIITNETPDEATSAPEEAIPTNAQQTVAPRPTAATFAVHETTIEKIDLASPETTSALTVPTTEPAQTSVPIMMHESATEMNLATAGDISPLPRTESEAAASSKAQDAINLNDFIPSQLPEEITAFVEAYLFGRPLSVIISRDRLKYSWGVEVKKEFGYVMLGFFRVLGLQEIRVKDENTKVSKLANGTCGGQVQWRFHLEWAPGGEEIILPNHSQDSFDWPWWNEKAEDAISYVSSNTSALPETEIPGMLPKYSAQSEPESRYNTTPRYRQARIANHEYKFRHCPLSDAYDSVLPEHVLVPFGRQHSDRVFPRGWLCTKCGRLNFQQALRQRKCPSSMCKDELAPADPYFYDLYSIRDPQERLPLNYPRNTYPPGTKVSPKKWEDGTQTFTYHIDENSNIFIKHIFLSNVGELQKPVSNLMEQVQLTVPLLRPMVDNNPYFFYTAKSLNGKEMSTKKPWDGVPDCINDAKKQVVGRTSCFAEVPEKLILVKHLKIVAWITEGSRRGNEVIRAKNKCAILLAMGCTTMLTVTPRSLGKMKAINSDGKSRVGENSGEDIESGWVAVGGKVDDEPSTEDPGTLPVPAGPRKGRGAPKKKDRPSFTLSLYHGDMVVFYGDDFEYSFKRDGTSFMLFASHDEIV